LYTAKPVVVDPCSIDPLSSPICPGYALATIKNSILGTTVSNASAPIVTYAPGPAEAGPTPIPVEITAMLGPAQQQLAGPIQQQVMQQQGPMMGPMAEQQPPPPQQTQGGSQPGPANQNPGPAVMASSAPAPTANNPQAKVGDVSDSAGSSKSSSPVSLSSVLSMISSNQDKTSALEKSVVQAADAQAFSAGETAKQNAEKLAGDVQSQSIANSGGSSQTGTSVASGTQSVTQLQGSSVSMQGNQQGNSASNSARLQQSINSGSMGMQSDTITSSVTTQQQQYNVQNTTRQEFNVAMVSPSVSYSIVAPTKYTPQVQIEMPSLDGIKFGGHKGPVDNAMETKPFLPQMNTGSEQNDSVKKNVQNNDAAGNVTIESIAKMPTNYAQYFTAIPDATFYESKEIYKNQKNVDNARALRQLSSDRLHQEMINQQYKLGR
jgi:hypothetical protein